MLTSCKFETIAFAIILAMLFLCIEELAMADSGTSTPTLAHASPLQYTVVDIGQDYVPIAINSSMTVVLQNSGSRTVTQAYTWTPNSASPTPIPNVSTVLALNNNGDYIGISSITTQTFVSKGGAMVSIPQDYTSPYGLLPDLVDEFPAILYCLNSSGDVGGQEQYPWFFTGDLFEPWPEGVVWKYSDKSVKFLTSDSPNSYAFVYSINDSGNTLSFGTTLNDSNTWSAGDTYAQWIGLSKITDAFDAIGINNLNQVIGYLPGHAKVRSGSYSPSADIDLGVGWPIKLTNPTGTDAFDFFVLGYTTVSGYAGISLFGVPPSLNSPCVWVEVTPSTTGTSGTTIPGEFCALPLNELISPSSKWNITSVADVNDAGTTVGNATNISDGSSHAILLLPAELAVDANRDGKVVMANDAGNPANVDSNGNPLPVDTTSQANPYRFWINEDLDDSDTSNKPDDAGYPVNSNPDYLLNAIPTKRSLDNFVRLWMELPPSPAMFSGSNPIQVALEWQNLDSGQSPKIKVFLSADPAGSDDYRKTEDAAAAQDAGVYKTALGEVSAGNPLVLTPGQNGLPSDFFSSLSATNRKRCFIFEGSGIGKGKLVMSFRKSGGALTDPPLGATAPVYMDLKHVADLYQQVKATPDADSLNYPDNPANTSNPTTTGFTPIASNFEQPQDETKQWILWVHGWNVPPARYETQTQSTFKRLWWQGFKGRFCSFQWQSYITAGETFGSIERYAVNGFGYPLIEFRAYTYAQGLGSYMTSLKAGGADQLFVLTHSMGSVITSEALKLNPGVASGVVIMNGAISASAFDPTAPEVSPYFTDHLPNDPPLGIKGRYSSLKIISFHNPNDLAMPLWTANETLLKKTLQGSPAPTGTPGEDGYNWTSTLHRYIRSTDSHQNSTFTENRTVTQPYESLSFAASSHTAPLGHSDTLNGIIVINSQDYFGTDDNQHSGQMDRNIQRGVNDYYLKVLNLLGVQHAQ